jgi:leucyl-tRNA synthetase
MDHPPSEPRGDAPPADEPRADAARRPSATGPIVPIGPIADRSDRAGRYDPQSLEPRWRQAWKDQGLYTVDLDDRSRPKYYFLTMYPYPSGDLHVGHWYAEAPADAAARYRRMRGYNVLFPMGFDAFGLPAENAAIRAAREGEKVHPMSLTYERIARMEQQYDQMGAMFDWTKKVVTCDPGYYRWNQWLFLRMFERGLAYRKESLVNWDPVDQTVLANEQVIDGRGDRSGALVERRLMPQWHFKITDYADELLDFEGLDWPDKVKTMQTNWIGRSEGAQVAFRTEAGPIEVFTTRPDTLWGATFMVLAPEHPLVPKLTTDAQRAEVEAYQAAAARMSEIDRQAEGKTKTGVFTGATRSTPSPTSASRCGSPTTCSPPTAPARSWPCRPTTSATSSSPARSGSRSASSSSPRAPSRSTARR